MYEHCKCRLHIIVHASSTRLAALPPAPAVIDWSYYKTAVAKAGMVDEFEKKVNCMVYYYLVIFLFKPCM